MYCFQAIHAIKQVAAERIVVERVGGASQQLCVKEEAAHRHRPTRDLAAVDACEAGAARTETTPQSVRVVLRKTCTEFVGMFLLVRGDSAVLREVKPEGLVSQWNEANPSQALHPGDILVRVNGQESVRDMVHELTKNGRVEIEVSRWPRPATGNAPQTASVSDGVLMQARGACEHSGAPGATPRIVLAREVDFGCDGCAICLEAVGPDDGVMKLPCGHGFHAGCIVQFFLQRHRRACPLCTRTF